MQVCAIIFTIPPDFSFYSPLLLYLSDSISIITLLSYALLFIHSQMNCNFISITINSICDALFTLRALSFIPLLFQNIAMDKILSMKQVVFLPPSNLKEIIRLLESTNKKEEVVQLVGYPQWSVGTEKHTFRWAFWFDNFSKPFEF